MLNRTPFYEFVERFTKLNEVDAWIQSFDADLEDEIWKLIVIEQLDKKGIDDQGDIIGVYSRKTEEIDPRKKAGTPYTLNDTSAFINSLAVQVGNDFFTTNANGQKDNTDLFKKYGDGIIGLTPDNLTIVKEMLKDKFIEYVREILQVN
jgi:hypothetical protein